MSQTPSSQFSPLNLAERRSKLRNLLQSKGTVTLWRKGVEGRHPYRVKDFRREDNLLIIHAEPHSPTLGTEVLGSFDLLGVSFFFKSKVVRSSNDELEISTDGDFYKSERRRNFRLLTFPIYQLSATFKLPATYEQGKVLDIKKRPGQTGLFKNFLKLVDGSPKTESDLRLRVQDLSVTGMSITVGPAELDWFKTGDDLKNIEIHFSDEILRVPTTRIVYVVDQIGEASKQNFKVGLRFEDVPASLDNQLSTKINSLLRQIDSNRDFEDFLK